jgi:hypothetical protein
MDIPRDIHSHRYIQAYPWIFIKASEELSLRARTGRLRITGGCIDGVANPPIDVRAQRVEKPEGVGAPPGLANCMEKRPGN